MDREICRKRTKFDFVKKLFSTIQEGPEQRTVPSHDICAIGKALTLYLVCTPPFSMSSSPQILTDLSPLQEAM
jgi:hypothetical protein